MAFKLLSGEMITPQEIKRVPVQPQAAPQDVQTQPQDQSSLLGRLGIAGLQGIEAPGNLLRSGLEFLGAEGLKAGPSLSETAIEKLGYTPEQLKGQGPIERYAQRAIKQAPTAALFGAPAIARTAFTALPASAVGELGAPEWLQDLTQLGAEIGTGYVQGKIPTFKKAQKSAYDFARSLVGKGEIQEAAPIVEGLTESANRLSTEVDEKTASRVNHVIKTVKDNFRSMFERPGEYTKFINPNKVMDLRKSLNKQLNKYPDLIEYLNPIKQGFDDFFMNYSIKNPNFLTALKKADKLTAARNMGSAIENLVDKIPLSGEVAKFGKEATKLVSKMTLGGVERFLKRLFTNSEAQKLYWQAGKYAVEENVPLMVKSLNETISALDELPKRRERISKKSKSSVPSGSFKLISGEKI